MVQVDIFWAYGIGAGFGLASAAIDTKPLAESPRLRDTLLYQALVFGPSGFVLLWCFPSWETMHAGDRTLPAWLVALFAVTNVTQALLGFGVTRALAQRRKTYAAYLGWLAAYFAMFFVLIHGWDGSGYRRFTAATPEAFARWTPATALAWLTSDVAATLAIMGVFVVPPILMWMSGWLHQGHSNAGRVSRATLALSVLATLVVGMPAAAALASLAVRALGWAGGLAAFALVAWALGLRKGALLDRHHRQLMHGEPLLPAPALVREVQPC